MAKEFLTDEEMAALEGDKDFLSDEEMAKLEASEPASEAVVVDPTTAQFTDEEMGFAEATEAVDKAEVDVDKKEAADVGVMDALSVNIIDSLTLGNYDTAMPAIANLLEDLPPEKQKELYAIRQKAVTEGYPTASKVGEILGEALAFAGGVKGAKMLYAGGKSAVKGTTEIYKKIPKDVKDLILSTMDMMATGSPRSGYYAVKQAGRLGKKVIKAGKSVKKGKRTTKEIGEMVERIAKSKGKTKNPTSIKTKDLFKTKAKSESKPEPSHVSKAKTPARKKARKGESLRERLGKSPYSKKEWEAINKSRDKGMTGY